MLPLGQAVHEEEETAEYVPGEQGEQEVEEEDADDTFPAGQSTHESAAPKPAACLPEVQGEHVADESDEYEPGAQREQELEPRKFVYFPAGQLEQLERPAEADMVPASHFVQFNEL